MGEDGDLCYRCHYYDWGVPFHGAQGMCHTCNHPTGNYEPGFNVNQCDGFLIEKESSDGA